MNSVSLRSLILLLMLGLCVGGLWHPMPRATAASQAATTPQAGTADTPDLANTDDKHPTGPHRKDSLSSGVTQIPLLTTANKADWMGDEINAFNQLHQGKYQIVLSKPLPSRLAMQQIIDKKVQPVLWSPGGSKVWIDRLGAVWSQQNHTEIVDTDDPEDYKAFLRSPLVFLTTQEKAKYLRQEIGGPDGWQNIRQLSLGKLRPPWGKFSFAYANPFTSSTGMMTLGMILNDYALRTRQTGDLAAVANSSGFIAYLGELHRAFVCDDAVMKGSNALSQAYADNPSRYDFITTYESLALTDVSQNPDLAVVYPSPTIMTEQSVVILKGDWVTPEQAAGASLFMGFLSTHDALESGVRYNLRPEHAPNDVSLAPQLTQNADHGFQQTAVSVELPSYDAINSAIYQWRLHISHQTISP